VWPVAKSDDKSHVKLFVVGLQKHLQRPRCVLEIVANGKKDVGDKSEWKNINS